MAKTKRALKYNADLKKRFYLLVRSYSFMKIE